MSIVTGASPGPAPACQARFNSSAETRSSWRAWPHVKDRRNVPTVEGANTAWPKTASVDPARKASQSSIESPPPNAEWITVIALWPTFAPPAASPKLT